MVDQADEVIRFDEVTFRYPNERKANERPLIDQLSFSVYAGEFVSVIGASGSGKSTIFKLITGLEQAESGTISLHGVSGTSRLGQVGYMPQQDLLMPWRTVRENARLALELKDQRIDERLIEGSLEQFGLSGYEDQYPHELSGGMRQRVSFLRATLTNSQILLLDEPFSALDAMTKLFMQEWLLEQWAQLGQTIVFITHDISEALFLSDRILVVTEQPIYELKEIIVPLKRSRTIEDLHGADMLSLQQSLTKQLRAQVKQ